MSRLYFICVLMGGFSLASSFDTWSAAKVNVHTVENVETIISEYSMLEKSLWNLIRSSSGNQPSVYEIYDAHKKYMGKNFGEIGILKMVARELSTANRSVIENISRVNLTFDQGYELLKHRWYERMALYTNDVIQTLPFATNEMKSAILDRHFWKAVVNVCTYN